MTEELLFAGFGGQGILLAGKLIAQAGMDDGYHATWIPSYGPEMRGGTANCTVVYADDEIGSPIASEYDTVVVMNQPSFERFQPKVRKGGTLIVNTALIKIENPRDDITIIEVPANELATKLGSDRSANVVMVGAYNAVRKVISDKTLTAAIHHQFESKGDDIVSLNEQAYKAGAEAVNNAP